MRKLPIILSLWLFLIGSSTIARGQVRIKSKNQFKSSEKSNIKDPPKIFNPIESFNSVQVGAIQNYSRGYIRDTVLKTQSAYQASVYGILASMQNSFILGYFIPQKDHKIRIGDILDAGLGAGIETSNSSKINTQVWGSYHFDIGMVGGFMVSSKQIYKIYWFPLVYQKDQISPSVSGSSLGIEVQLFNLDFGMTVLARNLKILGFIPSIIQPNSNAHSYNWDLGYYLRPGSQIKILSSYYSGSDGLDKYPNQVVKSSFSIQIGYGIKF